jgi:hypothetical protein
MSVMKEVQGENFDMTDRNDKCCKGARHLRCKNQFQLN